METWRPLPPNLGDHEVDAYAPTTLRVVTFPENDMFVLEITFSNEKSHRSIWTFLAEDVYIFVQDMLFSNVTPWEISCRNPLQLTSPPIRCRWFQPVQVTCHIQLDMLVVKVRVLVFSHHFSIRSCYVLIVVRIGIYENNTKKEGFKL